MPFDLIVNKAKKRGVWGIPTLFKPYDFISGGLEPGRVYLTAARPGHGKTSWCIATSLNVARQGKRVGMISAEMGAAQLSERFLCQASLVSGHRSEEYNDEELGILSDSARELENLPISIFDFARPSIEQIKEMIEICRPDLFVVDHFQKLRHTTEDVAGYKKSSDDLLELARDEEIPIIVAAQLNRDIDKDDGRIEPKTSDIKDCGSLEEDAHLVMALTSNDAFRDRKASVMREDICTGHILKNRSGPEGKALFTFRNGLFFNTTPDQSKSGSGVFAEVKNEIKASKRYSDSLGRMNSGLESGS